MFDLNYFETLCNKHKQYLFEKRYPWFIGLENSSIKLKYRKNNGYNYEVVVFNDTNTPFVFSYSKSDIEAYYKELIIFDKFKAFQ